MLLFSFTVTQTFASRFYSSDPTEQTSDNGNLIRRYIFCVFLDDHYFIFNECGCFASSLFCSLQCARTDTDSLLFFFFPLLLFFFFLLLCRVRSGNPGYLLGKPVLYGQLAGTVVNEYVTGFTVPTAMAAYDSANPTAFGKSVCPTAATVSGG